MSPLLLLSFAAQVAFDIVLVMACAELTFRIDRLQKRVTDVERSNQRGPSG